jgi:hypothetical protein
MRRSGAARAAIGRPAAAIGRRSGFVRGRCNPGDASRVRTRNHRHADDHPHGVGRAGQGTEPRGSDMNEEIIPIFGIFFGIGGPVTVLIVWLALNYRKRRRLMELHHAERMAAIERGMDVPPLPIELIDGRSRRRRSSLLPGLVWFFIGLAVVVGTLSMHDDDIPIMGGLIPLGIGAAYLLYYFLEGRRNEALLLERDLAERTNGRQTPRV